MGMNEAKEHLRAMGLEERIIVPEADTATVELAAQALGVEPGRIAKTLTLQHGESAMLLLTAGDTKINNAAFKAHFHCKAKMLSPEDALRFTGHPAGGICPFGLPAPLPVYLDVSLKRFGTVFPACGTAHSAVRLTCEELERASGALEWVEVCVLK